MIITLNFPPDVEEKFLAKAQAHGMSADEFAQNILLARVQNPEGTPLARKRPLGRKSLVELFAESPLKGLDLDFQSKSRHRLAC